MDFDITIIFCELYFNLSNKNIHIALINNEKLSGHFNGYYYEDLDTANKKIATWHFVESNDNNGLSPQEDEYSFSKLIPHKLIKEVLYIDNNSNSQKIKFK